MATRRTDIRRGGIDLATLVADPSMIDGEGKLKFPDGTLTQEQVDLLTLLLASIKVELVNGVYVLSPLSSLATSLGSDTLRFKDLYVDQSSIHLGNKKLSVEGDVLKVFSIDTSGNETETASLSTSEIQANLLADVSASGLIQLVSAEIGAGPQGPSGADGKSAYQNWIDLNNTGNEQDFLNTLKGADGVAGQDGAAGADGVAGVDGVDGQNGTNGAAGADADNTAIADILISDTSFQDSVATSSAKTIGGNQSTYADGLYQWSGSEQISEALDQVNVVLSALAPKPADNIGVSDIDAPANGANGYISFPNDYTAVSTVSGSPFTAIANGALYAPTSNTTSSGVSGTHRRLGIRGKLDLTADITTLAADGTNYTQGAFNTLVNSNQDGDLGELQLWLNGTEIATYDLPNNSLSNSSEGSGFSLSSATPARFPNNDTFNSFMHRTGTYTVRAADQLNGWNYLQVIYDFENNSSTAYKSQFVEWVVDDTADISVSNHTASNIITAGTLQLSGVKYHTSGSFTYSADIDNLYKATYSDSTITLGDVNSKFANMTPISVSANADGNVDKTLSISQTVNLDSDATIMKDETVGIRISSIPHPTKPKSNQGLVNIGGMLIYNRTETASDIQENFITETNRLKDDSSYSDQTAVTNGSWDSTIGLTDELMVYDQQLIYPTGNFNLTYSHTSNPDYTSSTGTKTYVRKFKNNSNSTKDKFRLYIKGNSSLVDTDSSLGNNVRALIKFPGTTEWLDVVKDFNGNTGTHPTTGNFYGALGGTLESNIGSNTYNLMAFNTLISHGDYILVKIIANENWSGYISTINIAWDWS